MSSLSKSSFDMDCPINTKPVNTKTRAVENKAQNKVLIHVISANSSGRGITPQLLARRVILCTVLSGQIIYCRLAICGKICLKSSLSYLEMMIGDGLLKRDANHKY